MTKPLLGCIADDYTGATDLCSMLVRSGMSVVLSFGVPTEDHRLNDVDVVVVALKSRSIAAAAAVQQSLDSLRFLQTLGVERFFFKYCSTFDSTPLGNIGPVADALADALHIGKLLFCPAFPENGRTVYQGWLFVGALPLHESSMKDHPLNPMTDSNLIRWLQMQSTRPVHRLPLAATGLGDDHGHYIADVITEADLQRVAKFACEHRLLTGGSAIARHWVDLIVKNQPRRRSHQHESRPSSGDKRTVILAGSCSEATRTQIREFETSHPAFHFDLPVDKSIEAVAEDVVAWCKRCWSDDDSADQPLLICSAGQSESIAMAHRQFGKERSALMIEDLFGKIAQQVVQLRVGRLIVAGGETSGAVMNALQIDSVRVGREITAGVPWVTAVQPPHLAIALKSGNFGGPRFFLDALETAP